MIMCTYTVLPYKLGPLVDSKIWHNYSILIMWPHLCTCNVKQRQFASELCLTEGITEVCRGTRDGVDNHSMYIIEFLDYKTLQCCGQLCLHE